MIESVMMMMFHLDECNDILLAMKVTYLSKLLKAKPEIILATLYHTNPVYKFVWLIMS